MPHKGEEGKASMIKRIRAYYSQEATQRRAIEREWRRQRDFAGRFGASHVDEVDAIFARHL